VKKILQKKIRDGAGWILHVRAGAAFTAEAPVQEELTAETPSTPRKLSLQKTFFTNVILSAAGRFACKSTGGVEEPLHCRARATALVNSS
jgi:hypothetical protein